MLNVRGDGGESARVQVADREAAQFLPTRTAHWIHGDAQATGLSASSYRGTVTRGIPVDNRATLGHTDTQLPPRLPSVRPAGVAARYP